MEYLTFAAENELSPEDIEILSGLSFVYAIYEIAEHNGIEYLRPIERTNKYFIDESISSILKYTGKTNELFTRMMINIAFFSQDSTDHIKLLDPVAGKGTTLFEGFIKGYNVYGIEIGEKVVVEIYHFLKRFLETEKYKHRSEIKKISGSDKSFVSVKYSFEVARTKEDQKNNSIKSFEIIAGNSINADAYYKKNYFDMIVGDLPYGVQHGNVTNEKQSTLTRNPMELMKHCLPVWSGVLKRGGAIVLAWNTHVLSRDKMEQIFAECGLAVKNETAYLGFEHRVNQSILRDIIVAVKR